MSKFMCTLHAIWVTLLLYCLRGYIKKRVFIVVDSFFCEYSKYAGAEPYDVYIKRNEIVRGIIGYIHGEPLSISFKHTCEVLSDSIMLKYKDSWIGTN